jgi:hypothetical protein
VSDGVVVRLARVVRRRAPLAVCVVLINFFLIRAAVAQDAARLPDLTGTWVIDVAKSNFGGYPAPKADTAIYKRDGFTYTVNQAADQGRGLVHLQTQWPTDSGEVTNVLPDSTTVVIKAHVEHGVQLFTSSLSRAGQTATMTGRIELAADHMTMTRVLTIVPPGGEPVNLRLVYVKKS